MTDRLYEYVCPVKQAQLWIMAHLAGSDNAVTCEGSNEVNYQLSLTAYLICLSSCSLPGSPLFFFTTVTQTHTAEYTSVLNTHRVTHTHTTECTGDLSPAYTHTHTYTVTHTTECTGDLSPEHTHTHTHYRVHRRPQLYTHTHTEWHTHTTECTGDLSPALSHTHTHTHTHTQWQREREAHTHTQRHTHPTGTKYAHTQLLKCAEMMDRHTQQEGTETDRHWDRVLNKITKKVKHEH